MYETLKSAFDFEHRSHDCMSARARRPPPLLTESLGTKKRIKE